MRGLKLACDTRVLAWGTWQAGKAAHTTRVGACEANPCLAGTIPDENATASCVPADFEPEEASPLPWSEYYEEQHDVQLPSRRGSFHIYTAGKQGPVLLFLHGAGFTGLSWAPVAKELLASGCHYRIVALDHRGHGLTRTDDDIDLSADTLAADAYTLWQVGLAP